MNRSTDSRKRRQALVHEIVSRQMHQGSTAAVLFHHALAERLGLGPTDHKVFDLLRERGAMSSSDLVALTGLTSGAMTGVVARLEQTGFVRREADPKDGRRQILTLVPGRIHELYAIFHPMHKEVAAALEGFDARQLEAIAEFLTLSRELIHRHTALLRASALSDPAYADSASTDPALSIKSTRRPRQ